MKTPTLAQFKQWSSANGQLAMDVCKAMAFAQCERQRVDAYIKPVFDSFTFLDDEGQRITNKKQLYLCQDDALCASFYAACDTEHRKHGFTGEAGNCPAAIAEYDQLKAEWKLLDSICALLGLDHHPHHSDDRRKLLDLAIGAALKAAA